MISLRRVLKLEDELNVGKIDFESLEIIYKNSSCNCTETTSPFIKECENYKFLQNKIRCLIKTLAK